MKKTLFFTFILSVQFSVFAAESFSTLEERMSGVDFKATGLSNLTDEELKALNEWVRSHSVATLENAVTGSSTAIGKDLRGFENQPKDSPYGKVIKSNIVGTFNGWRTKDHTFTLANGMIWQPIESGSFSAKKVENPAVTIKKGAVGSWRLYIDGYNKGFRVRRIQ